MAATETFLFEGHIIDSLLLAKVLDLIVDSGADHRLTEVEIGRARADPSRVVIEVTAPDPDRLDRLVEALRRHGVVPLERGAPPGPDEPPAAREPDRFGPARGAAPPRIPPVAHVAPGPAPAATPGSGLGWGRRFLMCPPDHFEVMYEINPWMQSEVAVDPDRAREQWEALAATLRAAGAQVEVVPQAADVPDMVFTANAGIVNVAAEGGPQFVPSHFRHVERRPETEHFAAWFAAHGWSVDRLPAALGHEGAGDALPFADVLVSAYRFRSDQPAATRLSTLTGAPVRSVELVDERLYHLDITFCPLDARRAMGAPLAWDRYGRDVIEALVPEPLWLTDDEALTFCANSVVVGSTIVMPATPVRVGRRLEAWGFDVVTCDVGEFLKAGGGCRCLTLALDVPLGPGGRQVVDGRAVSYRR